MMLHFPLDPDSGAAGVTLTLADHLRSLGHEVSVVGSERLPQGLGRRSRHLLFPFYASARAAMPSRRGPDVIDASTGDLAFVPRRLVSRSPAVLLTRSHGLEHLEAIEARNAAARGEMPPIPAWSLYYGKARLGSVARSLRVADGALFLNATERDWAVEHLGIPDSRAFQIRNGVAPAALTCPPPEQGCTAPGIAVMGPAMWRKGAREAGTALAALLRDMPGSRAVWLGASEDDVARVVGPGYSSRLRVVPRFRQEEVPDLLSGHQVLIFMSRFEGLPGSVLEAMACGLAIVAADIPGVRDILAGVGAPIGRLVEPGDVRSAVSAVKELFSNPGSLADCRLSAWKRARDYSWEAVAAETVALYRQLLRRKSGLQPGA